MGNVKVLVPNTDEEFVEIETAKLPQNVTDRLIEMALNTVIRSGVTSAFANDLNKAKRDHDASQEGVKKPVAFDPESYETDMDALTVAEDKVAALYAGEIRAARGKSGENKALIALVLSNVISALKAKGKKHKEAAAMIGGDPFAFIEKSARKRAGDDDAAYRTEIAKLNALYVDPAKAILGGSTANSEEDDADDLI